jgi:hypothetical protein
MEGVHWGEQCSTLEDNVKINLQEAGGVRGDWMELSQDRDRWRALVRTGHLILIPSVYSY